MVSSWGKVKEKLGGAIEALNREMDLVTKREFYGALVPVWAFIGVSMMDQEPSPVAIGVAFVGMIACLIAWMRSPS